MRRPIRRRIGGQLQIRAFDQPLGQPIIFRMNKSRIQGLIATVDAQQTDGLPHVLLGPVADTLRQRSSRIAGVLTTGTPGGDLLSLGS